MPNDSPCEPALKCQTLTRTIIRSYSLSYTHPLSIFFFRNVELNSQTDDMQKVQAFYYSAWDHVNYVNICIYMFI